MATLLTLSSSILGFHNSNNNLYHTTIPIIHLSTQTPILSRSISTNNSTTPRRKRHPCNGSTSYLLHLHLLRSHLPPRCIPTHTQLPQTTLHASSVDDRSEHKAIGSNNKSRWPLRERFPPLARYASVRVLVRRRGTKREKISG